MDLSTVKAVIPNVQPRPKAKTTLVVAKEPLVDPRDAVPVRKHDLIKMLYATASGTSHTPDPRVVESLGQQMVAEGVVATAGRDAKAEQLRLRLVQRNVDAVLAGSRWLSSKDLNEVRYGKTSNGSQTIKRWVESGMIFSLETPLGRMIPAYGLDELGEPIEFLKPVLQAMAGRTGFLIASWFESPNTHLGGKRPREVLATRGLDVIRAAQAHVAEGFHG
ncbi:hypothetical protein ACG02S_23140 [Roseateles sp. DC23W]|uniref:Antitoxin Xre/MbcA/ParS-like toxin-binding domain-containing protein n=1 Tax=Pelomonas dachongensis TaxID=3299029 RepID=A0ABW7EVD9_9BURK